MPRSSEAALAKKREYDRQRVRRLRGTTLGGDRDSKGKGVVPRRNVVPSDSQIQKHRMSSPLEKGNVVPWPRSREGQECIEYDAFDNQTGEFIGRRSAWVTEHGNGRPLSRQQLVRYMVALAEAKWTLAEEHGLDNQPMYSLRRVGSYQQQPTTQTVKETRWTPVERTAALEQRILALELTVIVEEAEHVL